MPACMHKCRMAKLDSKDIQLLSLLQKDGAVSSIEVSDALGMSASQVSRRRQRLEADGYISRTVVRLDPSKIGLTVQAFIQIQMQAHSGSGHTAIAGLIRAQPEITAAWTLTGEADYLLRVYCDDLQALNRLIQDVLLQHPSIGRVQSQVVMDETKDDTALPLPSK